MKPGSQVDRKMTGLSFFKNRWG